jgi:hypothetical protein
MNSVGQKQLQSYLCSGRLARGVQSSPWKSFSMQNQAVYVQYTVYADECDRSKQYDNFLLIQDTSLKSNHRWSMVFFCL